LRSCLNMREGSLFTFDNCLKRIVFVRYSYLIVKNVNYSRYFFFIEIEWKYWRKNMLCIFFVPGICDKADSEISVSPLDRKLIYKFVWIPVIYEPLDLRFVWFLFTELILIVTFTLNGITLKVTRESWHRMFILWELQSLYKLPVTLTLFSLLS
jgi:hypothetical protein